MFTIINMATAKDNKQPAKGRKKDKGVGKKKHAGQPTKYKPEYDHQALILAEKGFTDREVARVFEVSEQTVNNWKIQFPQFFESLKAGKATADQKVVKSLYQRALGYSHPAIHISNYQGIVTKTDTIKHYPPDTTACIFWLKNRDQENWRDRQEHEFTGKDGGPVAVQIVDFAKAGK